MYDATLNKGISATEYSSSPTIWMSVVLKEETWHCHRGLLKECNATKDQETSYTNITTDGNLMEISGAAYDLLTAPRSDKGDRQQRTMADGNGTPKETHFTACMGRERVDKKRRQLSEAVGRNYQSSLSLKMILWLTSAVSHLCRWFCSRFIYPHAPGAIKCQSVVTKRFIGVMSSTSTLIHYTPLNISNCLAWHMKPNLPNIIYSPFSPS